MISEELQQIVDKFKEQGKMAFLEAAAQESIDKAITADDVSDITLSVSDKASVTGKTSGDVTEK